MTRPLLFVSLCVALLSSACPKQPGAAGADARTGSGEPPPAGYVELDGERVEVRFSDGDTFRIRSGKHEGVSARLTGFNTLEDYGPVHRWGTWTAGELYTLANSAGEFLNARGWRCRSEGDKDKYGRLLVACDDAAQALVSEGLAMVFAVDDAPNEALLKAQHEAQQAGRGMWAKGVPAAIITSVHSAEESGGGYNRVVDTRTGISKVRRHEERYATCQEVCEGPADASSCMTYVPYENRYKNKAECLRRVKRED